MKIDVEGNEIQIRPISYSNKLELKGHFIDVYKNGVNDVSARNYNKLLGHASEIAFVNPEEILSKDKKSFTQAVQAIQRANR